MPDELNEIERRLTLLRPASGGLDRDRMLFEAGRASARAENRERVWAGAVAASIVVALVLGVGLVRERTLRLGLERALATRTPEARPSSPIPIRELAPDSYLTLTRRALAGLDDSPRSARRPPEAAPDPTPPPLRAWSPAGLRDL
jgi:hypothetical protein